MSRVYPLKGPYICTSVAAMGENNCPIRAEYINYMLNQTRLQASGLWGRKEERPPTVRSYVWTVCMSLSNVMIYCLLPKSAVSYVFASWFSVHSKVTRNQLVPGRWKDYNWKCKTVSHKICRNTVSKLSFSQINKLVSWRASSSFQHHTHNSSLKVSILTISVMALIETLLLGLCHFPESSS